MVVERNTDGQKEEQKDRHTDRQKERQADRQVSYIGAPLLKSDRLTRISISYSGRLRLTHHKNQSGQIFFKE